jgi:hypothetical protein
VNKSATTNRARGKDKVFGLDGIGKLLIVAGLYMLILGALFVFCAKFGMVRLPGDIFVQKGNFTFYFPIVSSILLSLLLTLLLNFFIRR